MAENIPLTTANGLIVRSPLSGLVTRLEDVPDPVFSSRTLGHGIAIDPTESTLLAPCDGVVIHCARTRHALTIRTESGTELLIHVGLDTVLLDGNGITLLVQEGQFVTSGMQLMTFDADLLASKATSLITPVIEINSEFSRLLCQPGTRIKAGDPLLELPCAGLEDALPLSGAFDSEPHVVSVEGSAVIALKAGIHARPAARLAQMAKQYNVNVSLYVRDQQADVTRLTAVLGLGIAQHEKVGLQIEGEQAQTALKAFVQFMETPEQDKHRVSSGSNSETSASTSAYSEIGSTDGNHTDESGVLKGLCASGGVALAPWVWFVEEHTDVDRQGQGIAFERARFGHAFSRLCKELEYEQQRAEQCAKQSDAEILEAHRAWLDDPQLRLETEQFIDQGVSAGFAWQEIINTHIDALLVSPNNVIAERANDLRDLRQRLLSMLGETSVQAPLPQGAIILAHDLTPSQLIALDHVSPAGICLAAGGTTSHVAILARSRGWPCIVGMGSALKALIKSTPQCAVLDADAGHFEPAPSSERVDGVKQKLIAHESQQAKEQSMAYDMAMTLDGITVSIMANIADAEDARRAFTCGADEIGLFRSEFLFLDQPQAPDEERQFQEYLAALDAMNGKPVVIRTLDIGADKQLPYVNLGQATNPALGVRGIRLLSEHRDLLDTQLKALLRVAKERPRLLKIMVPMVSDVTDMKTFRQHITALAQDMKLIDHDAFIMPEIGAMIEVPSAALCAESLAKEADFFSIGTNDLTQYTLAMDREEAKLAPRIDVLHPAVLSLVSHCVSGASDRGISLSVCGAAASDDLAWPILVALGIRKLSVEPTRIPAIKAAIRALDCVALADQLSSWLCLSNEKAIRSAMCTWLNARR